MTGSESPARGTAVRIEGVVEDHLASLDEHVAVLVERLKRSSPKLRGTRRHLARSTTAITRAVLASIVRGEVDVAEIEALDELPATREAGVPA